MTKLSMIILGSVLLLVGCSNESRVNESLAVTSEQGEGTTHANEFQLVKKVEDKIHVTRTMESLELLPENVAAYIHYVKETGIAEDAYTAKSNTQITFIYPIDQYEIHLKESKETLSTVAAEVKAMVEPDGVIRDFEFEDGSTEYIAYVDVDALHADEKRINKLLALLKATQEYHVFTGTSENAVQLHLYDATTTELYYTASSIEDFKQHFKEFIK